MIENDAGRRPKLLVLASTYPRWAGDPEPGFVHELAKRLVGQFEVTALGPHAPGSKAEEVMDGVHVVRYRYAPARLETLVNGGGIVANLNRSPWKWLLMPGFLLAQVWNTWRLIARWRPDVIHAHWLLPQGLTVAALELVDRRTPPFVVTSHGTDLFSLRAWPFPAIKRFVTRRAAAVTVVSRPMVAECARIGVDTDRLAIEPMGVDLRSKFTPDHEVVRSRGEILFVGRLVKGKGLRLLVDALPDILKQRPGTTLTIAGFGPEEATLRGRVEKLSLSEKVQFLGGVAQARLPELYRRAAVFVMPFVDGSNEGLGLVLVEAAGCGCPLVAGDIPAMQDVIVDDSVGTVVPLGDRRALVGAVCAALEAPDDVASRKRVKAVEGFDWTVRAKAYARLLNAQVRS